MTRWGKRRPPSSPSPWRPLTRRAFASLLGLGALALVSRKTIWSDKPARVSTTRWIGHC